jgi:hypothetical protein
MAAALDATLKGDSKRPLIELRTQLLLTELRAKLKSVEARRANIDWMLDGSAQEIEIARVEHKINEQIATINTWMRIEVAVAKYGVWLTFTVGTQKVGIGKHPTLSDTKAESVDEVGRVKAWCEHWFADNTCGHLARSVLQKAMTRDPLCAELCVAFGFASQPAYTKADIEATKSAKDISHVKAIEFLIASKQ